MNKNGGVRLPKNPDGSLNLGKLAAEGRTEAVQDKSTVMNAEEQAMYLGNTVKCRIGPSKVHGVGVIAMRDIAKGEELFCALFVKPQWYNVSFANLKKYLSHRPEVLQLILDRWPQVVNGHPFLSPNYDARLTSFMNHSDSPNYDPTTDKALEDIKKGEEVFEDYRVIPNYEKAFPWLDKKEE